MSQPAQPAQAGRPGRILIRDEAPYAILRMAAMRLDPCQRVEIYREVWLPDLLYITRQAEGRPISRLLKGTRYSLGILRTARRQARDLRRAQRRQLAASTTGVVVFQSPGDGCADLFAPGTPFPVGISYGPSGEKFYHVPADITTEELLPWIAAAVIPASERSDQ